MFFLISFLIIILLLFKTKRSLHMLQQNLYNENNRYIKWNFRNISQFLNIEIIIILLTMVGLFMVYNLRESGNDPAEHQHNFGIVDHDYNAKPAYLALAQLNNILYDAEYKNRYTEINYSGARGFSAFEFEKGGKENVFVLWEHIDKIATVKAVKDSTVETVTFEDGTSNAVIKLPEGVNAEYYDMYGNKMSVADGAYCALTMEPIYVVCKKENDSISIERNGNTVKVTGQAEKPFAEVTLAAEKSSGIKRFVNLDQQQADSNGNYSFEFTVPDNINSVWAVYVYDGSAKQLLGQYDSNGFAMCTEYFVNGTAVNSFDGLKEGNEVSVKLTVDSKNSARPTFAGAIYGRSGVMTALSTAEWSVGADTATAEIKLKFENNADFSAMKYFIWDESLKPMVQPIIISQQREDK